MDHFLVLFKLLVLILMPASCLAGDTVYIRSDSFGVQQLVTSDTLRWTKHSLAKDAVLTTGKEETLCRLVTETKDIGSVSGGLCHVIDHTGGGGGSKSDPNYQVLSGHAGKVVWAPWKRPSIPPLGAIAYSENKNRFVAFQPETGSVGYLDFNQNLGTCVFPTSAHETQCHILKEIIPVRYELSEIELKKTKGFTEEVLTLAEGSLEYNTYEDDEESEEKRDESGEKMKVAKVFSYRLNQLDYWGQGELMAKGLHTVVKLPASRETDSVQRIIEWGIASAESDKEEDIAVSEDLGAGTGVNVTVRGIRMKGLMSYWATLKTIYKDETFKRRHIEGHRRMDRVEKIYVEKGNVYYLRDGSLVTEPTTAATSTSTTTTEPLAEYKEQKLDLTPTEPSVGDSDEDSGTQAKLTPATQGDVSNSARSPVTYTIFGIIPAVLIVIRTLVTRHYASG